MRFARYIFFILLLAAPVCAADATSLPPEEADAVAPAAGDTPSAEAAGTAAQPASSGDPLKDILKGLKAKADKGDPEAQATLGRIYYEGVGVRKNYGAAAQWYGRAAQQGYAAAQSMLSRLYMDGEGVPQSYAKAYFWFMLSLDPRDEEWQAKHDEIAQYLNADQIAEQDRILSEWRPSVKPQEEKPAEAQTVPADCPALDVFKTIPYPKTETDRCKESYKKTDDICHSDCGACEGALAKHRDVCAGIMTDQEATRNYAVCSKDSECTLIETDCTRPYSPIPVNLHMVNQVRRERGYPQEDCHRSEGEKEKQPVYKTSCAGKYCEMHLQ